MKGVVRYRQPPEFFLREAAGKAAYDWLISNRPCFSRHCLRLHETLITVMEWIILGLTMMIASAIEGKPRKVFLNPRTAQGACEGIVRILCFAFYSLISLYSFIQSPLLKRFLIINPFLFKATHHEEQQRPPRYT